MTRYVPCPSPNTLIPSRPKTISVRCLEHEVLSSQAGVDCYLAAISVGYGNSISRSFSCIASATDTDTEGKSYECTDMYMRNGKDYRIAAPLVAVAKKIDELIKSAKSRSKAAK